MHYANTLPLLSFLLALYTHTARAGIQFITPAGGATWPAGPISVTWKDGGGSPDMSELVSYTLQLIVGGNTASDSRALQTIGTANASVASGRAEDTIAAGLAQSVENGFYFMMVSNTTEGNQVVNYSDRFTLISMNGSTDAVYLDGANAAGGVTNVPEAQYNVLAPPSSNTSNVAAGQTSTASQSGSNLSGTSTATATSTPTPGPSPQQPVSRGLVAGLSLGLLVALIIIVSFSIWALVRWRKKRRLQRLQKPDAAPSDTIFLGDKAELAADVSPFSSRSAMIELSPTEERYEVPGHGKAVEADGASEAVYELEGEWDGWEAGSGRRSQAYDPTR